MPAEYDHIAWRHHKDLFEIEVLQATVKGNLRIDRGSIIEGLIILLLDCSVLDAVAHD